MGEYWGATAYTGSAGPYGPARYNHPDQFTDPFTMPDGDSNGTKIAQIRQQIMAQHPEDISTLADEWQNAYNLLSSIKDQLFKEGDALDKEHWKSADAKKAFLRKGPGEALANLDEWLTAANNNVKALRAMVSIAIESRQEMTTLWNEYQGAVDDAQDLHIDTLDFWEPWKSNDQIKLEQLNDAQEEYDKKARVLAYKYAQQYWDPLNTGAGGFGPPFAPMDAVLNPVNHPPFPANVSPPAPPATPAPPPPVKPPAPPNVDDLTKKQQELLKNLQKPPVVKPPTAPPGVPDPSAVPEPTPAPPPGLPGGLPVGPPGGLPSRFGGRGNLPGGVPGGGKSPFGRPSSPPGGGFRNGVLGRGSGGTAPPEPNAQVRNPSSPPHPPPNRGGKKARDPQRLNPPVGPEEEEAFSRPPSPLAPPVLNNRRPGQRRPGSREELMPQRPGQPGTPIHPDTAPPVLNSPARNPVQPPAMPPGRPTRGKQAQDRPGQQQPPGNDWIGLQQIRAEASSPVLDTPTPVSGSAVSGLEEVPKALRGRPWASPPAGAQPNTVAPELTARHTRSSTQDSVGMAPAAAAGPVEEGQRIVTDEEAFSVETPGGGVLGKRPEDHSHQAEPPTALGGR